LILQPALYALAPEDRGGFLLSSSTLKTGHSVVNIWDIGREYCMDQIVPDSEGFRCTHVEATPESGKVCVASSNELKIYDLRSTSNLVGTAKLDSDLVGIAAEVGNREHLTIIGYRNGRLVFLDNRMTAQSSNVRPVKEINAHSKGELSVIKGHKIAPIFATATASQVVKIWSLAGEQMGVVRAHSSIPVSYTHLRAHET